MHSPPALRALDLQVCLHTTLLPHKKPALTCVNTGLTCMLCGVPSLHALTCMLCGAPSLYALTCMLCGARTPRARGSYLLARSRVLAAYRTCTPRARAARTRGAHSRLTPAGLLPALTRNARRRPWRRAQRTAVPARERSRQRPEPHGRCARPRQDGFRRRSEALQ